MKTNFSTTNSDNALISALFSTISSLSISSIVPIVGSASSRRYYRITDEAGNSYIAAYGPEQRENEAFFHIADKLSTSPAHLPKVLAISDDRTLYIQQDLGDTQLLDVIKSTGFTPDTIDLCKRALDLLVDFQTRGARHVSPTLCYPVPEMDAESIAWDLNYFKYCFLKLKLPTIDEPALQRDFNTLTDTIVSLQPRVLIHRDFQSRNILVHDGDVWFIDFQGARRGPAMYDAVSFLWQARAGFPDSVRETLLQHYITRLSSGTDTNEDTIRQSVKPIVVFRMLQVLGAYGYRGLIQGNPNFKDHISKALSTLDTALDDNIGDYPYLASVIKALRPISDTTKPDTKSISPDQSNKLTVTVSSFSYKKGLPVDTSGNGGGYVFDCRAIHNPGRYEQYRRLTGDDPEVIEFLENDGEITKFLDHCFALVDSSIERYIKRGFTNLSVSFGCTGGQHRSVYSATHTARHIAAKYDVNVILIHREQNKTSKL